MKINDLLLESEDDQDSGDFPFKIFAAKPENLGTNPAPHVTVKVTEPRGVAMSTMKSAAMAAARSPRITGDLKKMGVEAVYTLAGGNLYNTLERLGYDRFKPGGMVFRFHPQYFDSQAIERIREYFTTLYQKAQRAAEKQQKYREKAPERRRAAAAADRPRQQRERQALYDKYGKRNVMSVTAKQIGGDDGYQWNVLINGQSMINGLTLAEVPYYKKKAYEKLVQQHGVQ